MISLKDPMNWNKKILNALCPLFILPVLAISLFLVSCEPSLTLPQEPQDPTLQYEVHIPTMSLDSVFVRVKIDNWPKGDSIRLLAPPIYADNPPLVQTGQNFCHAQVLDSLNNPIPFHSDSFVVGEIKSLVIHAPYTKKAIVEYYVKFNYKADDAYYYMPVPFIGEHTGYLQGSYLFMIPYFFSGTAHIWRDPIPLTVSYALGNEVKIFGDSPNKAEFATTYQLMFSTSALLKQSVVSTQLLFEGTAANQKYRCVNIDVNKTFSQPLLNTVENSFKTLLDDLIPKFGTLSGPPVTIITGINNKIGLEGMYAFNCKDFHENDPNGTTAICLAHEVVHAWVGIRVGDYQDPWWKEGTTSYLGLLLPKKNGLSTLPTVTNTLLDSLAGTGNASTYALSDPVIRSILFSGKDIGHLVYGKGAQVSMLLDRKIRESTKGAVTLISILSEFLKEFDGKSFYRNEYVTYLNTKGLCDVSDIFSTYVDRPGPIPASVLRDNFNALLSSGAFGDTLQ